MTEVASGGKKAVGTTLVAIAWMSMVPIIAGYFFSRTAVGHAALVLAQILYLAPVLGAVVATARAYATAPRGTERAVWGQLSLAAAFLLVGETFYAYYVLAFGGKPSFSLYDLTNLCAAGAFVAVILTASGAQRLEGTALWRLVFDALALLSVCYIAVYHFWVRNLAVDVPWAKAALVAGYSVVGVIILGGLFWLNRGMPTALHRGYSVCVAISIALFAVGMALSPLWSLPAPDAPTSGSAVVTAAAYDSVFLCGYYLMMMAGLMRVADKVHAWRETMSRPIDTDAIWPSTLLSAVVLVAIALMGKWAYGADVPAGESALYVSFATIAAIALVARTGVFSFETGALETTSTTDPITGAFNHRAFEELVGAQIAEARRKHERFALAVLDLDGFSSVNAAVGHAGGDEVLERVARALSRVSGRRGLVFRLSGDEFAVMAPSVTENAQLGFGSELLSAVAASRSVEGVPLSASVGVVMGDGASTPDVLFQRAGSAQAWAKYHGKARVVVYDERIVRALGVEDRLKLHEERAHIDVARALAAAADARDPQNYYHSRNVAALAVLLCEEMGLETERIREVEVAAMLHDVGKIALAEELLGTVTLTASQQRASREHSVLGAQLVESLSMDPLPAWIRAHHEHWDGSGYPDGLVGEAIPLESRIIALSDAYDGMTSGKRTGTPLSKAAALQEIDHGMGSRYDPMLAERFILVVAQTSSLGWSDEWPGR